MKSFFLFGLFIACNEKLNDPLDQLEAIAPDPAFGEVANEVQAGTGSHRTGPIDDAIPGDETNESSSIMIELLQEHCNSAHSGGAKARFWKQTAFVTEVVCVSPHGFWHDNYDGSLDEWGESRQFGRSWEAIDIVTTAVSVPLTISRGCTVGEFDGIVGIRWGDRPPTGRVPPSSLDYTPIVSGGFPLCYDKHTGALWINYKAGVGVSSNIASSAPENPHWEGMQRIP